MEDSIENLMNLKNEWNHEVSSSVKEGTVDCIRTSEVIAGLKKQMKSVKPQAYHS